jgi:signal transduction histidine kinase
MTRSRLFTAVWIALWVALASLVALQFYWARELSLAYEQRLAKSVSESAGNFRQSFTSELSGLLSALKSYEMGRGGAAPPSLLPYRLYHADAEALRMARLEAPSLHFEPLPWPEAWQPLAAELLDYGEQARMLTERRWFSRPWLASVEAPVFYRAVESGREEDPRGGGFLIVALDLAAIGPQYFHELRARSFAGLLRETQVSVRLAGVSVFDSSLGGRAGRGAFTLALLEPVPAALLRLAGDQDPWQMDVSPLAGALDTAVESLRYRNLAAGLGVALVLCGGIVFLLLAARRAERLQHAQTSFVAAFSHELRTPLTAISMLAHNLRDGLVASPEEIVRYGEMLAAQSQRLGKRIEDILAFAAGREAAVLLAPLELPPLIAAALEHEGPLLAAMTVEQHYAEALPPVLADDAALRSVLANLIVNAAKYAGAGQRLLIEALPGGRGWVEIRVSDSGPGLPAAERKRLFEPFFRGAAARRGQIPGSGLGLYLVEQRVRAMGGTIQVDSAAIGGLCFKIRLREVRP